MTAHDDGPAADAGDGTEAEPRTGAASAAGTGTAPHRARLSLAGAIRAALAPGVVSVDGVVYRERRQGVLGGRRGEREFDVRFPRGGRMRIRETPRRRYADIAGDPRLALREPLGPLIRPGARVVVLGGGTGALVSWLGEHVGPHGGVIALEADAESARFALRRYGRWGPGRPGGGLAVSFEHGGDEGLAGELDCSFDAAVVWLGEPQTGSAPSPTLAEPWRVLSPGGWAVAADAGVDDAWFEPGEWREEAAEVRRWSATADGEDVSAWLLRKPPEEDA